LQIFSTSLMSQPDLLKSFLVGLHLKWRDVSIFGYILRGAIRVLEELPLPAIEYRRLEPQFVTQIRDRHSFHQMPPQNGYFFFRRAVLPLLLHRFAPLS